VTHGREIEGETGEWSGYPVLFTLPRNMVYPALLPPMHTPWLPVVDWTDAPVVLNGLVRFAERRNLVSARVPTIFKWPLQNQTMDKFQENKIKSVRHIAIISTVWSWLNVIFNFCYRSYGFHSLIEDTFILLQRQSVLSWGIEMYRVNLG